MRPRKQFKSVSILTLVKAVTLNATCAWLKREPEENT